MSNLSQNQNQTFQTPMLAQVTMDPQPNTLPCQLYPSSVATVAVAGCGVKLVNNVGPNIQVDIINGASDGPVFGVIPYNMKKNVYSPGDPIEVVSVGGILLLKSYAAVPRGARVAVINPAASTDDPMVQSDQTINNFSLGVSLGYAAAGSTLIKVQVSPGKWTTTGVCSVAP